MNVSYKQNIDKFNILALILFLLFTSNHSLAELNKQEKIYTQNGYPYEGLVNRSEEVKIFFSEVANNVTCRVEVLQQGQIWRGKEHNTSLKKFKIKPLRACIDRVDAKKLLANTF